MRSALSLSFPLSTVTYERATKRRNDVRAINLLSFVPDASVGTRSPRKNRGRNSLPTAGDQPLTVTNRGFLASSATVELFFAFVCDENILQDSSDAAL